jgi:glycosyltransferase involved in cell wall biosynthesis
VKILEAAAYGKPVIATKIAAEGLDFEEGSEILICDNSADFASACVTLLKNQKLASEIGRNASLRVRQTYDREKIVARLSALIGEVATKAGST